MKVDRSSWHYQVFLYAYTSAYPPDTISLCEYFWKVIAMLIWVPISKTAWVLGVTMYALLWPVAALVALLCGSSPTHFLFPRWKPYKPFQVKSFQFYPIIFVWAAGAVYWAFVLSRLTKPDDVPWYIGALIVGLVFTIPVGLSGLLAALFGSIPIEYLPDDYYRRTRRKETPPGLFKSYLKAKKERICPLIEFTDEE